MSVGLGPTLLKSPPFFEETAREPGESPAEKAFPTNRTTPFHSTEALSEACVERSARERRSGSHSSLARALVREPGDRIAAAEEIVG